MTDEKKRRPNRPTLEVVLERIGQMPPDDLEKLGRALGKDRPRAATILRDGISQALAGSTTKVSA